MIPAQKLHVQAATHRIAHAVRATTSWPSISSLALAAALAGCGSAKPVVPPPAAPAPAKAQATLAELLLQAETAAKEGARERSRLAYREAAKAYPTAKAPWARLATDYFEAEDYGNAILAAQEVIERDGQDQAAQGILAVSGLRISAAALKTLRQQQSEVPTDTRTEAARLTQTLREVLGEPILVPLAPAATTAPAPAPAAAARPAPPRPVARPAPARAAASAAAPAPAPAPKPSANPLDRFK